MNAGKSADVSVAEPGDVVTFTLWYNNTGDGNAKGVWLNDTLPLGMTYVGASMAPTSVSGQLLVWYFVNIVHGTVNFINVFATVNPTVADGTVLTNTENLAYSDQLYRSMTPSSDTAVVTVQRPQITVVKVANVNNVQAGGTIIYTIWYNNTGSRNAAHVWINDTLPQGVTYVSSNPAPSSAGGLTYGWHFTAVAPGSHSITITVTVNATTPSGTILMNLVSLDYTSSKSRSLPGSSDTAMVVVPEFENFAAPVMLTLVLLIGVVGFRRRRESA